MPKRARCIGCGTSLHHKKKYQIFEVIGIASGRTSRMIEQYCEKCYIKTPSQKRGKDCEEMGSIHNYCFGDGKHCIHCGKPMSEVSLLSSHD